MLGPSLSCAFFKEELLKLFMSTAKEMKDAAKELSSFVSGLKFASPVSCVYNPLEYAWDSHEQYLERFSRSQKKVLFLGMNPGPWGMAQTGIPFGEIPAVRDWMRIDCEVKRPSSEHPKRPVEGFNCSRSEVSGRRLWGLFAEKFGTAEDFFEEHFVANYCPLVFMEESGKNRTPDKLPSNEKKRLDAVCDKHLERILDILKPEWAVGVGAFAESKISTVSERLNFPMNVSRVLHPSPASPAANRDWSGTAQKQLKESGIWK